MYTSFVYVYMLHFLNKKQTGAVLGISDRDTGHNGQKSSYKRRVVWPWLLTCKHAPTMLSVHEPKENAG